MLVIEPLLGPSIQREIEAAMEKGAEEEEAGDEMDAIDDDSEKSKGKRRRKKKKKRKSKALLLSSPNAAVSLSKVSPSPPSTSKASKDKRPRRSLVFQETGDEFTLHHLTVNPGEDLIKVMEKFNRHYKRQNICIISATGTASKVQIDDSPDPLKYEEEEDEELQLLCLTVGCIFKDNGDSQNQQENKLIASLSTFGGTVIGGILVGQFIAASPIHITAGTFKRINPGESSTANQNINLACEDAGVVPENVSEDVVAGTDEETMQQPEIDPNNADIMN